MRLNTTGSGEKEKIVSKLNELCINIKELRNCVSQLFLL
jgi:hypothetical protein